MLPGWGQYYQGRTNTAYLYGGGFLILAGSTAALYREYEVQNTQYSNASGDFLNFSPLVINYNSAAALSAVTLISLQNLESTRTQAQTMANYANWGASLTLAFYAWTLADLWLYEPGAGPLTTLSPTPAGDGLQVGLHFRF
ncbi:MAG: hypothetical protein KDK23_07780 [Leptospiraceae bacterium]|nr:hypothetical protein [Leptospiraceae bacterium]